jgi:Holliday junction DNA helicase RuvB
MGMKIGDPYQPISLLCRLPRSGYLHIDEIHCLGEASQESLYSALEDGVADAVLREGGRTRAVRVRFEPFTLIGATTRLGELSKAFRDRFRLQERLDAYEEHELAEVVSRAAVRLGTSATPDAALDVARRSRGTPREAIRILERARDVAQLQGAAVIAVAHVVQAAERLGIDERGLDRVVVKLLLRRGKPTGLEAIASRIGVDLETYRDVHEPWLERSGLVERTRDGRVATEEARAIFGARARFSA